MNMKHSEPVSPPSLGRGMGGRQHQVSPCWLTQATILLQENPPVRLPAPVAMSQNAVSAAFPRSPWNSIAKPS